jgi:putative ABC transport system substrate-binding protein
MRRREFIGLLSGAAAASPLAANAQQSKNIPTVGVLWHAGSAEEEDVHLSVLVKAFNDLGYVEGKNMHLDHRFPAKKSMRLRVLQGNQEVIAGAVPAPPRQSLIILSGVDPIGSSASTAAQRQTSTIPIACVITFQWRKGLDFGRKRSHRSPAVAASPAGRDPR